MMDLISELLASYEESEDFQTNDTINCLNAELEEARRKYQELMDSYAECELKLAKAMAEILPCQQQNDELRMIITTLREQLNELSLKHDSIEKELIQYKALEAITTEKQKEIKILRKQSTKCKSLLDKTKNELRGKCSEVRSLKNKMNHLERFVEELFAGKDNLNREGVALPKHEATINGSLDGGIVSTSDQHFINVRNVSQMHSTDHNEDEFAYNSSDSKEFANGRNKSSAKQKMLMKVELGNKFFLSECLNDNLEQSPADFDIENVKQQLCLQDDQYSPLSPLPPTPPLNNTRGQKRKLHESKMSMNHNPRISSTDPVSQKNTSNITPLSKFVPVISRKVNLLRQESEGFETKVQTAPSEASQTCHNARFQEIVFRKNSLGELELSLSLEHNKTHVMVDTEKEQLYVTIDMPGCRVRSTVEASGNSDRPQANSIVIPCQTRKVHKIRRIHAKSPSPIEEKFVNTEKEWTTTIDMPGDRVSSTIEASSGDHSPANSIAKPCQTMEADKIRKIHTKSPSLIEEKYVNPLMCVENLKPESIKNTKKELPQTGRKVTKLSKQITKKAPIKCKVHPTHNLKCDSKVYEDVFVTAPAKIEAEKCEYADHKLNCEVKVMLHDISERFKDNDLGMQVDEKIIAEVQSPLKTHTNFPAPEIIEVEVGETNARKEIQCAPDHAAKTLSEIVEKFDDDVLVLIGGTVIENNSAKTMQTPAEQTVMKKNIQKAVVNSKKVKVKKRCFYETMPSNRKPNNTIVIALELFTNPAFTDSHYKIISCALVSALLNPSNTPEVSAAVKPILNYLVSLKHNPMMEFMEKKDVLKLLPLIESCIVSCLLEADSKERPHLDRMVKRILEKVPYYILKDELPMYGAAALCRVITQLAKQTENLQVPFKLCCELLKDKHKYFPFLVASIAGVWPNVLKLPKDATASEKMLLFFILFALKNKPKMLSETHWQQCNAVISRVIEMPKNVTREEMINKFIIALASLQNHRDSNREEFEFGNALSMLAAIEGWQWAKEKILEPVVYPAIITLMKEKEPSAHKLLISLFSLYAEVARHCPHENLGLDYFEKYTTEVHEKSPEQMSAHYSFHINLTYCWAQIICVLLSKMNPDRDKLQMLEYCSMFLTKHQKNLLVMNEMRLSAITEEEIDLSLFEDVMAMANS